MPHIKSDLTNKNFSGPKLKEINVPDETGYHPQQEIEGNQDIDFNAMNALMASRNMPPIDPAVVSAYNARQLAKRQVSNQELDELEKQIAVTKQVKITGQERLSQGAKQRIEMLCGMSTFTQNVDIDGKVFVLKTLKGKDQRAAIAAASEYDHTVESPFEIRKQLLARALAEVAGTDIDLFLNNSNLEAKLDFIEELPEAVLIRLYNEYLTLVRDTQEKYAIKSVEDAKEVAEELKK